MGEDHANAQEMDAAGDQATMHTGFAVILVDVERHGVPFFGKLDDVLNT